MQNKITFDQFVGFGNIVSLNYHHSYEDSFTNFLCMDLNGQKVYLSYELLTFSNFGTWLRRFDRIFPKFSKGGGKIETISTIEINR